MNRQEKIYETYRVYISAACSNALMYERKVKWSPIYLHTKETKKNH
jgi:hypothetical protein